MVPVLGLYRWGRHHLVLVQPREVGALVPGARTAPLPEGWLEDLDLASLARPLAARMQGFDVWVHAVAPSATAPDARPEAARLAASALLDQTITAVRRAHGGEPEWGDGEWLNEAQGRGVRGGTAKGRAGGRRG